MEARKLADDARRRIEDVRVSRKQGRNGRPHTRRTPRQSRRVVLVSTSVGLHSMSSASRPTQGLEMRTGRTVVWRLNKGRKALFGVLGVLVEKLKPKDPEPPPGQPAVYGARSCAPVGPFSATDAPCTAGPEKRRWDGTGRTREEAVAAVGGEQLRRPL